jgi:uncharacterized protein (DUF885 family)
VLSILETDFILVTINESSMLNGQEVCARLKNNENLGMPWFVFTDAEKNVLANATGPNGNVGCPMMPEERAWFMQGLKKARINISDAQFNELGLLLHKYALEVVGEEAGALPSDSRPPDDASASDLLIQYDAGQSALRRTWNIPLSRISHQRLIDFENEWLRWVNIAMLRELSRKDRIDLVLLANHIESRKAALNLRIDKHEDVYQYVWPLNTLNTLLENKARRELTDAEDAAGILSAGVAAFDRLVEENPEVDAVRARRIHNLLGDYLGNLENWFDFGMDYDPLFTWWCHQPYNTLIEKIEEYRELFESDEDAIIGDPIGNDALLKQLTFEMVPYSPDELIEIAKREFAWCENEKQKVMDELNVDSWSAALDLSKEMHVAPGEQPRMIQELHDESVNFLRERDLITIPDLADEVWRMQMMTPERQKISPYFTGGEVISISYPTDGMTHAEKMKSMLGNNRHFSRATVHHELIPGHHLQSYMAKRWNTQRSQFYTPFYVEGWALYWELLLWDLEFPQNALDKVGMLFWRSHRCARIIFSLNFHLNKWSPQECVDFLVDRVGHERLNAEAEVRRSVQAGYGPLYQAAYMLGGLQLRALADELVKKSALTLKEFHDSVLKQGPIPIAAVRALLNDKIDIATMHEWHFNK